MAWHWRHSSTTGTWPTFPSWPPPPCTRYSTDTQTTLFECILYPLASVIAYTDSFLSSCLLLLLRPLHQHLHNLEWTLPKTWIAQWWLWVQCHSLWFSFLIGIVISTKRYTWKCFATVVKVWLFFGCFWWRGWRVRTQWEAKVGPQFLAWTKLAKCFTGRAVSRRQCYLPLFCCPLCSKGTFKATGKCWHNSWGHSVPPGSGELIINQMGCADLLSY